MARLIYSAIASVDGYVEDADGKFDWAAPDEEVFRFVNELERPIGTYLYGRRMYETMRYWETAHQESPAAQDFTDIWRAAAKIVFSRTLDSVSTAKTRIERTFSAGLVQQLKASADRDITVGGAELAGQALTAGLVDEVGLILVPTSIGGGKPALPAGARLDLELQDTHHFSNGTVYLRYHPRPA